MIAFHGNSNIKEKYVSRVKAHGIADEIIHGAYWERGKGCAVGCTIHGSEHHQYEVQLGIPRILALLEDRIFEGMANGNSKEFPLQFLSAIEPGADLSMVWYHFSHWLLVDPTDGVIKYAKKKSTKDAIQAVANLYARAARGEKVAQQEWVDARIAASATYAAYAAYAADAAYASAYVYAAYASAYVYADAAADAADAAPGTVDKWKEVKKQINLSSIESLRLACEIGK